MSRGNVWGPTALLAAVATVVLFAAATSQAEIAVAATKTLAATPAALATATTTTAAPTTTPTAAPVAGSPVSASSPAAAVALPGVLAAPAAAAPTAAAPKCNARAEQVRLDQPLTRTALRLSGGQPIRIVAIGSSSTFGAGASGPAASYPSQLEAELGKHFPGQEFTVLNRGVNGEEAGDMLARFETAVVEEKPHLVIWQVGTNAVLRDSPFDPRGTLLHEGIARLKAIRADVVLLDPQFAPKVIAKPTAEAMVALLAEVAQEEKVDLFRRFAMMRRWFETEKLPFESFVSADGLHMNDWSYACLAKNLGAAIAEAATRPTETASAPRTGR